MAGLVLLCQIIFKLVIPAGKRISSAMDGKLKSIHGAWIPAIHAGMTNLEHSDYVIILIKNFVVKKLTVDVLDIGTVKQYQRALMCRMDAAWERVASFEELL